MSEPKRRGRPHKKEAESVKRRAGRPEFVPTAKFRKQVEVWLGGGMSLEEVARMLGMSKNTLKKHLPEETTVGRLRRRSDVISAMYNQAVKGSVTAMRAYLGLNDSGVSHELAENAPTNPDAEVKAPKLGKKEQRAIDAQNAAVDIYAVPPPPKSRTETLQ